MSVALLAVLFAPLLLVQTRGFTPCFQPSFIKRSADIRRAAHPNPKGKPYAFWRVRNEEGSARCVIEVDGYRGLHLDDGFRGFVFDGETPVVVRGASFKDGGFGGVVWESSMVLGAILAAESSLVHGKRCLELGSGCGLAGLAAFAAGAQEVVLSDCGIEGGGLWNGRAVGDFSHDGDDDDDDDDDDGYNDVSEEDNDDAAFNEACEAARSSDRIVPTRLLSHLEATATLNERLENFRRGSRRRMAKAATMATSTAEEVEAGLKRAAERLEGGETEGAEDGEDAIVASKKRVLSVVRLDWHEVAAHSKAALSSSAGVAAADFTVSADDDASAAAAAAAALSTLQPRVGKTPSQITTAASSADISIDESTEKAMPRLPAFLVDQGECSEVVLGADLVYFPEDVEPLIETLCFALTKQAQAVATSATATTANAAQVTVADPACEGTVEDEVSSSLGAASRDTNKDGEQRRQQQQQQQPVALLVFPGPGAPLSSPSSNKDDGSAGGSGGGESSAGDPLKRGEVLSERSRLHRGVKVVPTFIEVTTRTYLKSQ